MNAPQPQSAASPRPITPLGPPVRRGRSVPLFMALRYLFSRKRVGAINIISGISVAGVAFGTAALLCTLSVFNGFRDLIGSLYTTFDPQIEVVPATGKFAAATDSTLLRIASHPQVQAASATLQDNALILFRGRPTVILIKGVDDHYDRVTGIRSILYGKGGYILHAADVEYCIPGIGLAAQMGGLDFGSIEVCAPRKGERVNLTNPAESFNVAEVASAGVCFNVNQRRYDENCMLTSLHLAQQLFSREGYITGLELRLKDGADEAKVKQELRQIAGTRYAVHDRLEQQQEMFNVMHIEKMMAYLFLTFILLVACFNIIGSVSMLIIDKRADMLTLRHLGASSRQIYSIFLYEGRIIALLGAVAGIALGLLLCWLQQTTGFISMGGGQGGYIVDAYPVSVHATDVLLVLVTVVVVGFVAVWYPVRYLSRKSIESAA